MWKVNSVSFCIVLIAACFSVHMRGSEYIPLLGTSDPDYSFLGAPDFDSWSLLQLLIGECLTKVSQLIALEETLVFYQASSWISDVGSTYSKNHAEIWNIQLIASVSVPSRISEMS